MHLFQYVQQLVYPFESPLRVPHRIVVVNSQLYITLNPKNTTVVLVEKGCPVTVSSIVTQSNYKDLESIVQLCKTMGVKALKFGTFSRYGRGQNLERAWELTTDQDREATELIAALSSKYKGEIDVYDWSADKVEERPIDLNHGGFACGAGNLAWVISEFGNIKPCVFLPEDRFTTGNIFDDDLEHICKINHIENLYTNLNEWEKDDLLLMIQEMAKQGKTIILTTHQLELAERVSEYIILFQDGQVLTFQSKSELLKEYNHQLLVEVNVHPDDQEKKSKLSGIPQDEDSSWIMPLTTFEELMIEMRAQNIRIIDLRKREKSLEKIFLELVGEKSGNVVRSSGGVS